jgi:hypothetical protein
MMAREANRKRDRSKPRLGKLPPLYKLFLNPYTDVRFTSSCPGCSGKTRQRKLPLAIHVHDFKDHLRFKPAPRWVYTGARAGAAQPR